MQKTILLIALTVFSLGAFAQSKTGVKTDVQFESTDGKYHIKIKKDIDGKITTIDKTYTSLEEMKNDPELEGINLHIFNGAKSEMVFFEKDGEEEDHDVNVIIELDGEGDVDFPKGSNHTFYFKSEDDEGDNSHNIKVWVDKDGETRIIKDGEEVEGNTWTDKDGKVYDIKKSDGKIMFFSGDDTTEFDTSGEGHSNFRFSNGEGEDGEHKKVMIFKSSDIQVNSEDKQQTKVVVEVITNITLHFEEVEKSEFNSIDGINAKSLKMDDLNYFPNPNNGKFTLQFKADERPTKVKITSLDGMEIYSEELSNFEGTYQNEIDLSSQKRGIYLLQIIQGNKASNKKIVIE